MFRVTVTVIVMVIIWCIFGGIDSSERTDIWLLVFLFFSFLVSKAHIDLDE